MNPQLKDISQWNLDYVRGLPVGEFDWLDFKDSRWTEDPNKCLDELSKYVSAFANYDGGYLVIGIPNPKHGQSLQTDEGVNLNIKGKGDFKSWMEDIIPNLTDPPIQKLNVHAITDPSGVSPTTGRCLIVIHIPLSEAAPHQARDRKYYTRIGSKLHAIGHRAVLDILNRKRNPVTRTEIYVKHTKMSARECLVCKVTNLSNVFSRYVMTKIEVPIHIKGSSIEFYGVNKQFLGDGKTRVWEIISSNLTDQPLFPQSTITKKIEYLNKPGHCDLPTPTFIRYRTYADNMPPEEGIVSLEDAVPQIASRQDHA